MRITVDRLEPFVARIFESAGCPVDEARRIAHFLVRSNLAGHDSHGVIRVPRYVSWLDNGSVHAGIQPEMIREGPVHAVVDGCFGFGQTVGPFAVDHGIAKAREQGLAVVAIRNSGHLGRIGDWPERAAEAGIISIHFVNTSGLGLLVAPFGSLDRRFSTNPFAAGMPVPGGKPVILDFATSVVAEGKMLVAHQGGKPLPDGALIDEDGNLSTDPAVVYGEGTGVNPRDLRSGTGAIRAMGEHKGSGLAFLCELLAGALTGSGCAREQETRLSNGMLSLYIRPDLVADESSLAEELKEYLAFFETARPVAGVDRVLMPGEPENLSRADRLANGIPLSETTWKEIVDCGARLGVTEDETRAACVGKQPHVSRWIAVVAGAGLAGAWMAEAAGEEEALCPESPDGRLVCELRVETGGEDASDMGVYNVTVVVERLPEAPEDRLPFVLSIDAGPCDGSPKRFIEERSSLPPRILRRRFNFPLFLHRTQTEEDRCVAVTVGECAEACSRHLTLRTGDTAVMRQHELPR